MKKILLLIFIFLPFAGKTQTGHSPYADSLINLLKGDMADTQRVNQLNAIALQLDNERAPDEKKYATQALNLAKKINYEKGIARAYLMVGYAEEAHSKYASAIGNYEKAYEMATQLRDSMGQASALGNMANAEYFIGDYTSSANHSLKAISLYEGLHYYRGLASCHLALGNVYSDQKMYGEALKQYREALAATKKLPGHPDYEARPLASIGNVHQYRKDYDSSIWYYAEAIKLFEPVNARAEISVCLNNMATAKREQKKTAEANVLLRKSLVIRRAIGDTDGVCSIFQNLSGLAADCGLKDSAMYFARYSLFLTSLTGSQSQRLDCYMLMSDAFSSMNRFDSAYYFLHRYTDLYDTLHSDEQVDALTQLRARYDDEKRQNELALIDSARKTEQAESARNTAILIGGIILLLAVAGIFYYRFRVKERLSATLEKKNVEITLQKTAITDSIDYAKKIQDSILPPDHHVRNIIPGSFILYEPKDVVSGDFYWVEQNNNVAIFAAVDCTGHGVPGALMSVIGFNLLNQAVNEMGLTKPAEILHHLDYGVNKMLRQSDAGNTVKDGMDLAVCSFDPETRILQYAGVFNPAYIVSKGELKQIKADKFPIGINVDGKTDNYTNHTIQLAPGDMIYLFSDGYADQFGGTNGKKFMYNRFRNFLLSIAERPVEEQKDLLRQEFISWKGNLEQVDDVLVIGVRVS